MALEPDLQPWMNPLLTNSFVKAHVHYERHRNLNEFSLKDNGSKEDYQFEDLGDELEDLEMAYLYLRYILLYKFCKI